jgi:ElaB/YqjD/DUF883 family membrane-anchored ribosome-binding protein
VSIVRGRREIAREIELERDWRGDAETRGGLADEESWGELGEEAASGAPREKGMMTAARDKVGELTEGAKESMGHAREQARQLGRRAKARVRRAETSVADFAQENPLAVGAVALAAGVGVGLLIPSTSKEDELLGDTRDRLMRDVRGSAREVGRAVKGAADEVRTAALR